MMTNKFIAKDLINSDSFSCQEVVLFKNKTIHLDSSSETKTIFYVVNGTAIFYLLDPSLKLTDTIPLVSGEIYDIPNNTKTFLIESLNTSDQDLKLLKITTKV